jgi:hypothetical protein
VNGRGANICSFPAAENSLEWRTNKPNFFYVLGQNLGFPIDLATVADEVAGK